MVPPSITVLPYPDFCAGAALGMRDVLLAAAAAAAAALLLLLLLRTTAVCAVLLLLPTQLSSWSRSACDRVRS